MDGDVIRNMVADVVLNRGAAVNVGANLGKDLDPRAADLRIEVAPQGPEMLVECFDPVFPAALHALALGRSFVPVAMQLTLVALRLPPSPALVPGPLHNYFCHVGAHSDLHH